MRGRALQSVKAVEDSNGLVEEFEQSFETYFKGKRISARGSSHYMASVFDEQCSTTSTS